MLPSSLTGVHKPEVPVGKDEMKGEPLQQYNLTSRDCQFLRSLGGDFLLASPPSLAAYAFIFSIDTQGQPARCWR